MSKHNFVKMYTIEDLDSQVGVINLKDVKKYEGIINGLIKYLKKNKHEIISSLSKGKPNEQNEKFFRLGDAISDHENGVVLEVHISE